ncbi:MAG: nucleotidyltransferase domain-containing protein [Myxococcaceae bacterium]
MSRNDRTLRTVFGASPKPRHAGQVKDLAEVVTPIVVAEVPGTKCIYVFGSWEREETRADSDIDIAALFDKPLEPVRRWPRSSPAYPALTRRCPEFHHLIARTKSPHRVREFRAQGSTARVHRWAPRESIGATTRH